VSKRGFTQTFSAAKGPKGLTIQARPFFDRFVQSLPDGQELVLTVEPRKDKRTNKQNRTLWGVVYESLVQQVADEVGYDKHDKAGKEQLHEGLLMLFGGVKKCPITGREVAAKRSSKMTVAEFADYIEWIARWAATEYGIVVELPSDREAA
jgi:hypothetical protein